MGIPWQSNVKGLRAFTAEGCAAWPNPPPQKNWVVSLIISSKNSWYRLDMWFANILPQSVAYLVILSMVSFEVQMFSILIRSSLSFLFVCFIGKKSKTSLSNPTSWRWSPKLILKFVFLSLTPPLPRPDSSTSSVFSLCAQPPPFVPFQQWFFKKSPNQITLHKGRDVPLFCSPMSPKCLEQCLAYSRCSVDALWVESYCSSGGTALHLEKRPASLSRPTRSNTIQPYPPCPLAHSPPTTLIFPLILKGVKLIPISGPLLQLFHLPVIHFPLRSPSLAPFVSMNSA